MELLNLITATHGVPATPQAIETFIDQCKTNKKRLLPLFPEDGRISKAFEMTPNADKPLVLSEAKVKELVQKHCADSPTPSHEYVTRLIKAVISGTTSEDIGNNSFANDFNQYVTLWDAGWQRGYEYWVTFGRKQKIGKAVGNFVRSNPNRFRIEADQAVKLADGIATIFSELTQQNEAKTEAHIVLSINPADFLMVSHPTTGWGSCLNLKDQSAGFNRLMAQTWALNPTAMVAFAYVGTTKIGGMEIPTRTWRQLLYADLDEGCVLYNRQYPSQRPLISEQLDALLIDTFAPFFGRDPAGVQRLEAKELTARLNPISPVYCDGLERMIAFHDGRTRSITVGAEKWICLACGKTDRFSGRASHICPTCLAGSR